MISQTQTCPIPVPGTVATGAAVECGHWSRKCVYLDLTGTITTQVQISADGTTFYNKGAALTADGFVEITEPCTHVRISTTAVAGGSGVGIVAGF